MIRQKSKHCPNCKRMTMYQKETIGDAMGCGLTILTLGLFLPVWILLGVQGMMTPYRCQVCGSK